MFFCWAQQSVSYKSLELGNLYYLFIACSPLKKIDTGKNKKIDRKYGQYIESLG